jgi:hypothetical protein
MNWQTGLLRLMSLASVVCGGLAAASDKPTVYRDELACGTARYEIVTMWLANPASGDLEYVSQSLWLTNETWGISTQVPLGVRFVRHKLVQGHRILDDRVTAWACIVSDTHRHYVLLVYSCRPSSHDCPADWAGEWSQILDPTGRRMTGDRNGMSEDVLRRLGIDKALKTVTTAGVGPNGD